MTPHFPKLTDPDDLVSPRQLAELDKKLSACLTGMYRKPASGGDPFLFALTIAKPHVLAADVEYAAKRGKETGKDHTKGLLRCPTAATDGRRFYWHPDFLSKLSSEEVPVVLKHEQYHVLFDHVNRMPHASYPQKAYAIDYVVNACIEQDHRNLQRRGQLWDGNLGRPIPLKELLDFIDGTAELTSGPDEARIFADVTLFGRSPESIYDELCSHWDKSPRRCGKCGALSIDPKTGKPKAIMDKKTGKLVPKPCPNRPLCSHNGMCCPDCGTELFPSLTGDGIPFPMPGDMPSPLDSHLKPQVSKQEVQAEMMKAASATRSMRGTIPGEIESLLGELAKPVISWTDIVFNDCLRKSREKGLANDWSRPRKRWFSGTPSIYMPDRYEKDMKWLALLDTSGSMGDDDIRFVLGQMQVLTARGTDGVVVPVDAVPHWHAAKSVKNLKDLKTTKIVGRGGTVFEDFFRDFPKKVGIDFDAIIILTDGDCGHIPLNLRPPIPVTWVLTRHKEGWAPSFGRTAPLRHHRM